VSKHHNLHIRKEGKNNSGSNSGKNEEYIFVKSTNNTTGEIPILKRVYEDPMIYKQGEKNIQEISLGDNKAKSSGKKKCGMCNCLKGLVAQKKRRTVFEG
jgi:hypothetical protein